MREREKRERRAAAPPADEPASPDHSAGSAERFFEHSRDLLCMAGFDGYFKRVNRAWEPLLGYTPEELTSRPAMDFVHPDDTQRTLAEVESLRISGVGLIGFESRCRTKAGRYVWLEWSVHPMPEERMAYGIARDVTDRRLREAELAELASRDSLTGLYNRRRFDEALEHASALRERHGTPGTVVMLDLDGLKVVNDARGHMAGDEVLGDVAAALKETVRGTDLAARLGGDEFGVLLTHTEAANAGPATRRLLEGVLRVTAPDGVGVSLGVAALRPAETSRGACDRADAAMYEAKRAGGSQIRVADAP